MTKTKAERVTKLVVMDLGGGKWAAFDGGTKVAEAKHYKQSMALMFLVDAVYKIRQREVFERDGWMCLYCGSGSNLTTDHRVNRSKGRDDTVGNLDTACMTCHDKLTKGQLQKRVTI